MTSARDFTGAAIKNLNSNMGHVIALDALKWCFLPMSHLAHHLLETAWACTRPESGGPGEAADRQKSLPSSVKDLLPYFDFVRDVL